MKSYSQNSEDLIALDYFINNTQSGNKLRLLSVGENDGLTFSNARLLIENGFEAVLIEPSSVFDKLQDLYVDDPDVICLNVAIDDMEGETTLYESGCHVPFGNDRALVSTLDWDETLKWRKSGVEFTERKVKVMPLSKAVEDMRFDFITIDCEGFDWQVLKQIDLGQCGCKMLCIEHNGDEMLIKLFTNHCHTFLLTEYSRNRENIIFAL